MWYRVAAAAKIAPGTAVEVTAGDRRVALFNVAGSFHATDFSCTHAFAPLAQGYIEDEIVECPLHAGQFHIPTGRALCAPASVPLQVYPVRQEPDGWLAVEVAEAT